MRELQSCGVEDFVFTPEQPPLCLLDSDTTHRSLLTYAIALYGTYKSLPDYTLSLNSCDSRPIYRIFDDCSWMREPRLKRVVTPETLYV